MTDSSYALLLFQSYQKTSLTKDRNQMARKLRTNDTSVHLADHTSTENETASHSSVIWILSEETTYSKDLRITSGTTQRSTNERHLIP